MNVKIGYFFGLIMVLFLSSLVVAEDWVPSKDLGDISPLTVGGNKIISVSGITPSMGESADFYGFVIEGPTAANFTLDLDVHPEKTISCKGIDIDYYMKKESGSIEKVSLRDASGGTKVYYHTCEEFQNTFQTLGVTFPSAGEYFLKVEDSSTASSTYSMEVSFACKEGMYDGSRTKKCVESEWISMVSINGSESSKPTEIPSDTESTIYTCVSGCELESKCYPFGFRMDGKFCDSESVFMNQTADGEFCENLFECESNACVADQCVSAGLIQKILNWFRGIFG